MNEDEFGPVPGEEGFEPIPGEEGMLGDGEVFVEGEDLGIDEMVPDYIKIPSGDIKEKIPNGKEIDFESSEFTDVGANIIYKESDINFRNVIESLSVENPVYKIDIAKKLIDAYDLPNNNVAFSVRQLEKMLTENQLFSIAVWLNNGVAIDWDDEEQIKYFIVYDHITKKFTVDSTICVNTTNVIFLDEAKAQSVIDNVNFEDLLNRLFRRKKEVVE